MPLYDCGDPDCGECQRAFGPDRSAAFERTKQREKFYNGLALRGTDEMVTKAMKRFHNKLDEVEAQKDRSR